MDKNSEGYQNPSQPPNARDGRRIFIDRAEYYHSSHRDAVVPEYIHGMQLFLGDEQEGVTSAEPSGYSYLFHLNDLTRDNFQCLHHWYDKYDKLKPVVELYEAGCKISGISAEMLFLNLVQAMEIYTRNYYTHYSPNKESLIFSAEELPYVNGLLKAVFRYHIMEGIGIAEEQIAEKVRIRIVSVMNSYSLFGPECRT